MSKDTPYLGLFPSQPTELSLPDTVYGDDKPSFALVAQLIEQMRPSPVMSIVDLGDSRRVPQRFSTTLSKTISPVASSMSIFMSVMGRSQGA
jgi:hypothetical protein